MYEDAFNVFKNGREICKCLEPQRFNQNGSQITIGSSLTQNILTAWVTKMSELIQVIKPTNGSFCSHDIRNIKYIIIDMGKLYHLLVKSKVRPSGHQRLAHLLEYVNMHGITTCSERVGELAHQPLKKAARDCKYVRNDEKLLAMLAKAREIIDAITKKKK